MTPITNKQLIQKAKSLIKPTRISKEISFGYVGCALVSASNKIYTGVNIDTKCGIGFCAEHSAIASMITNGEHKIKKLVAVSKDGILPPCGRCREFIHQIDKNNYNTEIIIGESRVVKLKNLLPYPWQRMVKNKC
ncbi:MAG: cytidine deaminase family protein [Planctomycetota bacterium]